MSQIPYDLPPPPVAENIEAFTVKPGDHVVFTLDLDRKDYPGTAINRALEHFKKYDEGYQAVKAAGGVPIVLTKGITVEKLGANEGERLVWTLDVNKMPAQAVKKYMNNMKETLNDQLGEFEHIVITNHTKVEVESTEETA